MGTLPWTYRRLQSHFIQTRSFIRLLLWGHLKTRSNKRVPFYEAGY